jgi:hypothetical protein
MGTVSNPGTEFSAEHSPARTERFRVELLESLKKHELQGGLREIAKDVKNWNSLSGT